MYIVYALRDGESESGFFRVENLANLMYQIEQTGLMDRAVFFTVDTRKDAKLVSETINALLHN